MRKDIVLVNAICKAEEVKLLSSEILLRLGAASLNDALKMLHDYGYNDGVLSEDSFDIDKFISKQINMLIDFIKEYSPSIEVEEFLLAPYLFNNIKAEYKRKRGGAQSHLYKIDLSSQVVDGDYSRFDNIIADALIKLDELDADSQTIDWTLTKAMYAYKLRKAKKSGSALLMRYVKAEIDTVNIITACRSKNDLSKSNKFFISGGNLCKSSINDLPKEYENFELSDFVKLETQVDNYLLESVNGSSGDMDTVGPLLSYTLKKTNEFKTVKMILVCIKSDARNEIQQRIRGML